MCTAGISEDSDYTSDVNYPVGQHPNSSASQFLGVVNQISTPQRSLASSRENSYEDAQIDQSMESYNTYDYNDYNNDYDMSTSQQEQYYDTYEGGYDDEYGNWTEEGLEYEDTSTVMDGDLLEGDGDMSYNSRPNNRKDYRWV